MKYKKRLLISKKQSITTEQNCLPYFYRGFRYHFENKKLISVKGKDVVFIIPFDLSEKINISLDVSLHLIKSIKSIKKSNILFNKSDYKSNLFYDNNLIELAKNINFNIIQINFDKEVNFQSLIISI